MKFNFVNQAMSLQSTHDKSILGTKKEGSVSYKYTYKVLKALPYNQRTWKTRAKGRESTTTFLEYELFQDSFVIFSNILVVIFR